MSFFVTVTAVASSSSASPKDSSPVFLKLAQGFLNNPLLRPRPLLPLLHLDLGLQAGLLLRPLLGSSDARDNVVERVLDDADPLDLWRNQGPLLRIDVEIPDIEDIWCEQRNGSLSAL